MGSVKFGPRYHPPGQPPPRPEAQRYWKDRNTEVAAGHGAALDLHRGLRLGGVRANAEGGPRAEAPAEGGGDHGAVGPDELVHLLLLQVQGRDREREPPDGAQPPPEPPAHPGG